MSTAKKVGQGELRRHLIRQGANMQAFCNAVIEDFEKLRQAHQVTREVMADQAVELDALKARLAILEGKA